MRVELEGITFEIIQGNIANQRDIEVIVNAAHPEYRADGGVSSSTGNLPVIRVKQSKNKNTLTMDTVIIPESDAGSFKKLQNGDSIQTRTIVTETQEKNFQKGKLVTVNFGGSETQARIVSDPIVISEEKREGKKTLSLILESQKPGN
jgi:hypothetical protein